MAGIVNRIVLVTLLTVCLSPCLFAEESLLPDNDYLLPDLFDMESFHWQHLDSQDSNRSFEKSANYNRHLIQGAVMNYLESKFTSLGIPRSAVTLTGAAVIFAAGQDAQLNLNKSKTMSLQFKDMREEDRAILYRLKYSW